MRGIHAILIAATVCACQSAADRQAEEEYARRVGEVLTRFESSFLETQQECQRGPLECAAAAQDGADAARRARDGLAALTPPSKLTRAHQGLIAGVDHLATAYDEIAGTYWNQSDMFDAYVRAVRSTEDAVKDIGAASVEVGFKGDSRVWAARR